MVEHINMKPDIINRDIMVERMYIYDGGDPVPSGVENLFIQGDFFHWACPENSKNKKGYLG